MKKTLFFLIVTFLISTANAQCLYKLPFANGANYKCSQGNSIPTSWSGYSHYVGVKAEFSFDFSMPVNTSVYAVRSGTVSHVTESYTDYNNPSNCNYVNRLVIDHGDGTSASYIHLTKDGVLVNVGDYVTQGQLVAKSGQTGCSTGPHLHLMVMNSENYGSWYNQSIPISFCDVTSNGGVPVTSTYYSASACTFGPPISQAPTNGLTNVSTPVNFNWNDVSGDSPLYRIQVSTSASGWTAADGFTASATESSTVRVNQNTGSISAYSWLASSPFPPEENTVYYWTVKDYVCSISSNYSPVKSFTTVNTAGIEFSDANDLIHVYPNPVIDELIIENNWSTDLLNFEILNSLGQVVYTGEMTGKVSVQMTHFSPGVYLIKLGNHATSYFRRIIKE